MPGGPTLRLAAHPPILLTPSQPPKDDKKKKDAGKSAKKDKDPVNKSGGKAKKKVGAGGLGRGGIPGPARVQRGRAPERRAGGAGILLLKEPALRLPASCT